MATIIVVRTIHAPAPVVFKTVADPSRFAQAISGVTKLEFLSSVHSGRGTRFRQSRVLNGRKMTMDFEVTDYLENERVRIVNEIHGTRWDSVVTLDPSGASSTPTMRMDTTSRPLVTRLLMPLMLRLFIRKSIEKDFDSLKAFCEKSQPVNA